jgi:hypothetical protein
MGAGAYIRAYIYSCSGSEQNGVKRDVLVAFKVVCLFFEKYYIEYEISYLLPHAIIDEVI